MGGLFSRRQKVDFEAALKDLDESIEATTDKVAHHRSAQRATVKRLLLFALILEILYGVYYFLFRIRTDPLAEPVEQLKQEALWVSPLIIVPLVTFILTSLSTRFFKWRIRAWEKHLEELKEAQMAKLEELKETMDFKRNFNLLLTYSQKLSRLDPAQKMALFSGIDFQLLLQQQQYIKDAQRALEMQKQEEEEKQRKIAAYKARLEYERQKKDYDEKMRLLAKERAAKEALMSPSTVQRSQSTVIQAPIAPKTPMFQQGSSVAMDASASRLGPPIKPRVTRATVDGDKAVNVRVKFWDRLLDAVMGGEDFSVSCGGCNEHFRSATKDEADNIEFICAKCGSFNASNLQRPQPITPRAQSAPSMNGAPSAQTPLKNPNEEKEAPKTEETENEDENNDNEDNYNENDENSDENKEKSEPEAVIRKRGDKAKQETPTRPKRSTSQSSHKKKD